MYTRQIYLPKYEEGKTILEILSIFETEFKDFSGSFIAAFMHLKIKKKMFDYCTPFFTSYNSRLEIRKFFHIYDFELGAYFFCSLRFCIFFLVIWVRYIMLWKIHLLPEIHLWSQGIFSPLIRKFYYNSFGNTVNLIFRYCITLVNWNYYVYLLQTHCSEVSIESSIEVTS